MKLWHLLPLLLSLWSAGCNTPYRLRAVPRPQTPLFIAIPRNNEAIEPIGQQLYNELIKYYQERGYHLVTTPQQGYSLHTLVTSLRTAQRFISQDVVLFNKLITLELLCTLRNFRGEVVKEKSFTIEGLIPKAHAPLQQDAYTFYYLHVMLERHIHKIEQTFRPHLQ